MALGGTYTTGTVSTDAEDAKKLVFSGTLLESVAVEGDWIEANGAIGIIASVDDDTNVTLEQDWTGGTLTDSAYVLIKSSWLRYDPAITQAKIREFIAYIKAQGSFLFVTGSEPDPAMGEDGQYALKTNGGPWQLWYKTGGVWEAQGIPVGTTFRGEWNSATEYFANDQVGHNGSTWGAIAGSTNVEPGTDDEVWSLSAQAGADGQHGGAVSFTQVFSTSTSNADPGDGMLRLNNATQSSATVIRTDYLDKDGNSLTDLFGSLTTSTSTVKGQIRLAEVGDPTRWIIFDLTAKSDMTGYFNLTVAHVAHSTNALRDGEEIGFYFTPKGDVGQQGIQGNQGYAPVLAVVSDGDRRVFQVTDWTGSTGTKPATGKYVGTSGLVDAIGDAIDVRGTQGIQGEQGLGIQPDASGPLADRDTYDDEAAGFVFVDTDATPFDLYIKLSATTGDWSAASPIGGAGDMLASVYDPNAVEGDAFDLDNMSPAPGATGKLLFTATNEADALDTLGATTVGVDVLTATDAAAARTALEIQAGASSEEQLRMSVAEIYLSKVFGVIRRVANLFATGFKGADDGDYGIETADSDNYEVTAGSAGAITGHVAPTSTPGTSQVPTMTSNTTPSGVASASPTPNNGQAYQAFDGLSTASEMYWLNANLPGVLQYQFTSGKVIQSYILRLDSVFDSISAGGWRSWTFEGSNNGSDWTTLDTRSGLTLSGNADNTFTFSNSTSYTYYRWRVTLGGSTRTSITEAKMIGAPTPDDMTLVTAYQTADLSVSKAKVALEIDDTASLTLDADITVEVTCNGGTNWTAASLATAGKRTGQDGRKIIETVDQACTAGTSFAARVKTDNGKDVKIYGITVSVH